VVLTGEGADEFLGGYDIFKEAIVRQFWARQPDSTRRSRLLQRLYPHIDLSNGAFLAAFFREGLLDTTAPAYSHAVRWRNGHRLQRFLSEEMRNDNPEYPPDFPQWGMLERAQYLEATIFLSQYLLSSQGDRMGMAHAVEGRFPFLDHRLVEFCCRLPSRFKLRGLTEKYLLKRLGHELLPPEIWQRTKQPYRAPIHRCLLGLVSPEKIAATGLFRTKAVAQLVRKIESGVVVSESDDMALAGIVSTQLVHQLFVANFKMPPPLPNSDDVKVCHEFQPSSA
jgi:asparagine synthase (glutamine-hydrolysing)